MDTLKDKCAIAGVYTTDFIKDENRGRLNLALEAITGAAEDAGLNPKDIDGIVRYTIDGSANDQILVSNLGIKDLSYSVEIPFYGGSGCATVGAAAAAVAAGLAKYVVAYRAVTTFDFIDFTKRNSATIWSIDSGVADFMRPYGWLSMMDTYGLTFEAHSAKYGTTTEQLGAIAVAIRECANRNPKAVLYDVPLTMEDHRNSPIVSGRITADDVTLLPEYSGACAVIVTSAERAKDLKQPPVTIMAAASGLGPEPSLMWEMRLFRSDPTLSPAKYVAPRLFGMAGIGPEDIDVAEFYDCATVNVLLQIEDYGFCEKGQGGSFAAANIGLKKKLPITTSGGMLAEASNHGFGHVVEGAKQIRGTSTSQVENANFVMVTSSIPTPTSGLILRR
jgi:acetyl-CoA acetyltransferase